MQHCSVHLHWRTRMTLRSLMFYHSNWPKDKEWCNCTTIWLSDYLFHKFLERMLTRRDLMAIVVWSLVGTKSASKVKKRHQKMKKVYEKWPILTCNLLAVTLDSWLSFESFGTLKGRSPAAICSTIFHCHWSYYSGIRIWLLSSQLTWL